VAEPDPEMKRIVTIGLPLTAGAMSENLFLAITVAFISVGLGTDSMLAYLLSVLLIGFTDELVGSVVDAESTLCSFALATGRDILAGQYVQAALICHTVISASVLAVWAFKMEDVVEWLLDSPHTAQLAREYTQVIAIYHFVRSTSRIFMVIFQLTGNELFDTRFAVGEGIVTVVTVCCTVSLVENTKLETVAWIQVIIGCAALIAKIAYGSFRGWMVRFREGILSFGVGVSKLLSTLWSSPAISHFDLLYLAT
jgi:Na+-driven multidrug efflux pump